MQTRQVILFLFAILSSVQSIPEPWRLDIAANKDLVRRITDTISPAKPAPLEQSTQLPPSNAPGGKSSPRIIDRRHRAACDTSLTDEEVCKAGEACVEDPWAQPVKDDSSAGPNAVRRGVCTPNIRTNMCDGLLETTRKCSNEARGWKCGKPSRCGRENIQNCDWLCVQPPTNSPAGGKGFGF
jgi:hypothetical protein